MHDVFISYAAKDKVVADAVCAALEADHIRCYIAPRDVLPGHRYAEALVEAIHSAQVFVLVFSAASNSSNQVEREVDRAVSCGLPVLPLRVEDVMPCDWLEYYLAGQHWLDALTPPLEDHLGRLSEAISILLQPPARRARSRFEEEWPGRWPPAEGPSDVDTPPIIPPPPTPPYSREPSIQESPEQVAAPVEGAGAAEPAQASEASEHAATGNGNESVPAPAAEFPGDETAATVTLIDAGAVVDPARQREPAVADEEVVRTVPAKAVESETAAPAAPPPPPPSGEPPCGTAEPSEAVASVGAREAEVTGTAELRDDVGSPPPGVVGPDAVGHPSMPPPPPVPPPAPPATVGAGVVDKAPARSRRPALTAAAIVGAAWVVVLLAVELLLR
jgi:hypothetical protein